MTSTPLPTLSLLETRVLGVLAEKQHTVPDTYPLTLNALVAGCNQKTSRHPILEASEVEVQAALDHLHLPRESGLVRACSGPDPFGDRPAENMPPPVPPPRWNFRSPSRRE